MAYFRKIKKWLGFTQEQSHGTDPAPGQLRQVRLQKAINLREIYSNSALFYDRVVRMLSGEEDGDYVHIISETKPDNVRTFQVLPDGSEIELDTNEFIRQVFYEAFGSSGPAPQVCENCQEAKEDVGRRLFLVKQTRDSRSWVDQLLCDDCSSEIRPEYSGGDL